MARSDNLPSSSIRITVSIAINVILGAILFVLYLRKLDTRPTTRDTLAPLSSASSSAAIAPPAPPAPAPAAAAPLSRPSDDPAVLAAFLKTYRAADPAYQSTCHGILSSSPSAPPGLAQFSQDIFLLRNLFLDRILATNGSHPGFYIDVGANDPLHISNTLFFDKCLGWKGVCVEPQTVYHAAIRKHRSCHLVPTCVSNSFDKMSTTATKDFGGGGFTQMRPAGADDAAAVECVTLKWIFAKFNITRVDFLTVDVEGMELEVLRGHKYDEEPLIEAVILEDFWLPNREVDFFMGKNGFVKYQQMAIDSLYVRREVVRDPLRRMGSEVYYPPDWETVWRKHQAWRANDKRVRAKMQC